MTTGDEAVRDAGTSGQPREWHLPAAGDFRQLVERLPLIAYVDAPLAISPSLYVSPQTTQILGYTPEDWASDPDFFTSILHPDDRERVIAETAHMIATGERLLTEYRLVRRDGSVAWVRDEGVLVNDDAGNAVCLQGYIVDITEQKEREAALLEGEAIVDSSFDAIVGRTPDGSITSWNAAAERMFGYTADEIIGESVAALMPPEDKESFGAVNARLNLGHAVSPFEAVRVTKDGRMIDVETTVSQIVGPHGDILGVSSISRDIGERKRSQALANGQAALLEFIAAGAALPYVLDRVARFVEEQAGDDVRASILLLDRDGQHLRHGAAPTLPAAYADAIDGMPIGPHAGSCGTAAFHREREHVSDIARDPRWANYRELALGAGLQACWSTPIVATDSSLLGTFALYYATPRERGDARSSWSSWRPTWPPSRSSARAPRTPRGRARSATGICSKTPTSPSRQSRWRSTSRRSTPPSSACSATPARS